MKSLKDLQKIKERVLEEIKIREQDPDNIILEIGMGTCGIAAGAREVMQALLEEIKRRNLNGIQVIQTGCIGLCGEEPLVVIKQPKKGKIIYGNLDENKARQIVSQHLVNGIIIKEWVVTK